MPFVPPQKFTSIKEIEKFCNICRNIYIDCMNNSKSQKDGISCLLNQLSDYYELPLSASLVNELINKSPEVITQTIFEKILLFYQLSDTQNAIKQVSHITSRWTWRS